MVRGEGFRIYDVGVHEEGSGFGVQETETGKNPDRRCVVSLHHSSLLAHQLHIVYDLPKKPTGGRVSGRGLFWIRGLSSHALLDTLIFELLSSTDGGRCQGQKWPPPREEGNRRTLCRSITGRLGLDSTRPPRDRRESSTRLEHTQQPVVTVMIRFLDIDRPIERFDSPLKIESA